MNRSDLDRLRDARAFARHAQNNAGGLSAEALVKATQPQHAALYDLAVIGEALNRVSVEVKSAAPDIAWREFYDLRNFIVHAYWQIDLEIVAEVLSNRLDALIAELHQLIPLVERLER
jgi:uncharacterized protein with HEPN domain